MYTSILKFILVIIFFFNGVILHSQHFEWAASSGNIDISYTFSTVDATGNLIIGGESKINWTHRGPPEIYSSNGNVTTLDYMKESELVVCYSPRGAILWHIQMSSEFNKLHGITHDAVGNIVLLLEVIGIDENSREKEIGYLYNSKRDETILAGYYLIYLDQNGTYKSKAKIFSGEQPDITISSFLSNPKGGFLITGFTNPGKLCNELKNETGLAGGDFLLKLNSKGNPEWADVVSYIGNSCCSHFSDLCKATVAPDGTVYFGGTYFEGATFGGYHKVVTPILPENTKHNKPYEAYIASYSPKGKLNWVKTTSHKARFNSMAATNSGLVFAIDLIKHIDIFGVNVDTTGNKFLVIGGMDKKGNILWTSTSSTDKAHEIRIDIQNHIYVLGTNNEVSKSRTYDNIGLIGTDTLQKSTDIFIARFSADGSYEWVKEAEVPITTSNEPLLFNVDNCGNLYVSGTLFFSFKAQLSIFDKAFLKGSVYGPAPFVSRFKNTVPLKIKSVQSSTDTITSSSENKSNTQNESCIISPGPWKIRNYPNPFASATTFEYSITYIDFVTLELYDLKGNLIETLFANKKHEPGKFTFAFAKELASGTYMATIKGTEAIATCKIVVAK